jgi:hypothetical protein
MLVAVVLPELKRKPTPYAALQHATKCQDSFWCALWLVIDVANSSVLVSIITFVVCKHHAGIQHTYGKENVYRRPLYSYVSRDLYNSEIIFVDSEPVRQLQVSV